MLACGDKSALWANSGGDGGEGFFRVYRFPARGGADSADEGSGNNSVWAIIAGVVKSFGVTFETALYDMSYVNVVMYMRTLPDYSATKDKKGKEGKEVINADDPRNRDRVNEILFGNNG